MSALQPLGDEREGAGEAALARVTRFGRALREAGLAVGTGSLLAFTRAAAAVPGRDLYWAGRATLVSRQEEIAVYDRVFGTFFGPEQEPRVPRYSAIRPPTLRALPDSGAGEERRVAGEEPETSLASAHETLREKSFARCTPEELARLARLMARITLRTPTRRTRRRRPAHSGSPDLRRTLRRALRTGGDPVDRAWRRRKLRRRRVLLLVDVSGSMSAYSRALLIFAHAALRADPGFEAFCFGTRLTRLTPAFASADPDEALRRAAEAAPDFDGGTRIGAALHQFLERYGHPGLARGAVVVILSDGLDVGDPEYLGTQMARLARLAHRVVWLNPLKENPEYAPLARGMKAALPSVDVFASGHDVVSLEGVAEAIARL